MTGSDVAETIRSYLQEEFLYDRPEVRLDEDFALIEEGLIDSIGIFRLVNFLETTFGVTLGAHDMNLANFGSIRSIARLVASRRGTGT